MPVGLIPQALLVPRILDAAKAKELVRTVQRLNAVASFRNVWRETARQSIIRDHKTVRVYLDLLIAGKILEVRTRDVGSVYQQQIYSVKNKSPKICVGLGVLLRHGLNWDISPVDIRSISTDFDGLVRSKRLDAGLMASLEDCLVDEIYTDARKNTGSISMVTAILSTKKVELPYLLRRADQMHVGKAVRILFKRMLEITSSNTTTLDASIFLAVRDHFLKIARQYTQSGSWKFIDDEKGVGNLGVNIVRGATESDVVIAAAKQLGVIG